MKRSLLILPVLLAVAFGASAQQSVNGTLRSAKDGKPLMYVNVALMRAADSSFVRGTTTDVDGRFSIQRDTLPCLLRFTAIGYENLWMPVPEEDNPLFPVMHEGTTTLNEITISDKKPLYSVDGEKDLYNVSEDASVQTGNASDVLQNAPGVQVDVQGNITLNGNSVAVWINDRPSHLEGEALKQYIKTLPANSIERVEVMKNPSAKYGGGGPVINIVTNQKLLKNSFVSFGANGSSKPSISPWASYVYSNEKFRISAYINYNGNKDDNTTDGASKLFDADSLLADEQTYRTAGRDRSHNFWFGLNGGYEFDTMNSLSAWFGAYPTYNRSDFHSVTERAYYGADYSYESGSDGNNMWYGGYGGLDYTHKFNTEGHQYSIGFNGNFWGQKQKLTDYSHYRSQPQLSYDSRSKSNDLNVSGTMSIDYSLPYSEKGELEMGLSFTLGGGHDYTLRDTLAADGNYYIDCLRSDSTRGPSHSLSGYLSWRRKWGDFTLKLGGRLTYSNDNCYHLGQSEYDVSTYHFRANPSVHMSYRTKNMHNFSFGYTYHIVDPRASNLCTYKSYGVESLSTGNTLLDPEYVHNADLSWNKYFDKFGSVGLSATFNADIDAISSITDPQYVAFFNRVVPVTIPYNAGDNRKGTLSANIMYRPNAFFNVRFSGGITDDWYRVQVRPDKWAEDEMFSWNVRVRVWAKLWKKVEVFASGYYNSPAHGWEILNVDNARKGIDLGMSADFFDRKLSLYLNVNDIFDWNDWGSSNINPYNPTNYTYKYTSRFIIFGATLRFGKMELEGQARTGATENSPRH